MINKDNVLDVSWNNESMSQIRIALQELLTALGDSIEVAEGGRPAELNLSVEGTVLTVTVTLADGETELSSSVDLAGAISAAQVAVEIVNNLYTNISSKALSAAMGLELDRASGTVLRHMHWVAGAAHASLSVGAHARYFEPELNKIYHFYGYTPPGQGQPELGLDVYTPPASVIFYDIETGSCYRFDGLNMVDILSSKANDNAVVKSISVNGGQAQTPNNGNVNIEVQAGGKGDKGDKGDTVVLNPQGMPQFNVVNDLTTGGPSDALSAEMGKRAAGREATDRQRINAIVAILKKAVFTDDQSAAIAALDELADATDSISLDKPNYLFNGISGTLTLVATTDPSGKSVTWSSSNPSVATVNNGVVTPVAEGSTIISATTEDGKAATCTVTVQAFAVDTVSIDQSSTTYDGEVAGTTHQLTATTSPAGGAVLWSSSNTSVATINETTGLLAIVGNGQTTITAMDATRTKTDTITIAVTNVVVPSITLNQNTITSNGEDVGDTHQLTATVVPNTDTVQWSSSDDDVATVDNTGLVTIVGNGDCTITATSSRGLSATCAVTVSNVQTQYVDFQGDNVAKAIVLANYPHADPNEITKAECAAVTSLFVSDGNGGITNPWAEDGKSSHIVNGDFFQYFTGIQAIDDPDNNSDTNGGFGRVIGKTNKLFSFCKKLETVVVPEGIKRMAGDSFESHNDSIRDITLPSTIISIKIRGVRGTGTLTVKAHSWDDNGTTKVPGFNSHVSDGFSFTKILVPADSVEAYKAAPTWSNYASLIEAIPE